MFTVDRMKGHTMPQISLNVTTKSEHGSVDDDDEHAHGTKRNNKALHSITNKFTHICHTHCCTVQDAHQDTRMMQVTPHIQANKHAKTF